MYSLLPSLIDLFYLVPAILLALSVHEYAHGYASYRLGDPTPATDGRLSLNPLRHLDPIGTLMLILFKFGWAKPVMVNPQYYKHPKRGMAMVGVAGPLANYTMAFVSVIIIVVITKTFQYAIPNALAPMVRFFSILANINIGLGTFNMIPIPPLDGSKVFGAILPEGLYERFMQISMVGFFAIIVLLYLGILTGPFIAFLQFLMDVFIAVADKLTFFLDGTRGGVL